MNNLSFVGKTYPGKDKSNEHSHIPETKEISTSAVKKENNSTTVKRSDRHETVLILFAKTINRPNTTRQLPTKTILETSEAILTDTRK
jgi:hypothetical protein